MVRLQTLDLRIGVRVPASQPSSLLFDFSAILYVCKYDPVMRPLATLAFCALSTVAPALHAQDAKDLFDKAPPAVDEALRARIHQFYQAHVDGKYRIADQVVAEDSKDFYFAAQKPKYNSCETVRINYSENFTKADAVIACKADWYIHGERNPTTLTITSN